MNSQTDYKSHLYNILNKDEKDIIRKDIYNFDEILSIMDYINPIYIEKELYFNTLFKRKKINKVLDLVCTQYLQNINNNHENFLEESNLISDFIKKFYDVFQPIEVKENYLGIYPKKSIEEYVSRVIDEKEFNISYIDEKTLDELIVMLMAFSKFELNNINSRDFEDINFPTLILANIKLYEKGILSIKRNNKGQIQFNLNSMNNTDKQVNISNNETLIMYKILDALNKKTNENFTINDFM